MTPDLGKLKQLAEEAAQATPGRWTFNVNPATVLVLFARIEALEAGLKPFAKAAGDAQRVDIPDSAEPRWVEGVTMGDFRRAAHLLDDRRPCTCHPDDNPPRPCPQKFALSECRAAGRAALNPESKP